MSLREDVAHRAFVWGLPAVTLYGLLHELVLAPAADDGESRWNRALPAPSAVHVVGLPSLAVLGSSTSCAWLDLRAGPIGLEITPDATRDRSSLTLHDLHVDVVASVPEDPDPTSSAFLVVGPGWDPVVPSEVVAALRCRTDLCLVVSALPGSAVAVRPPEPADADPPPPLPPPVPPVDVARPPTTAFLVVLDWMLGLIPVRPGDEDLRADLEVVGVGRGPVALTEAMAEDLRDGQVTAGLRRGYDDVRRAQTSPSSRPRRTAS
jgi:hypothetical protein